MNSTPKPIVTTPSAESPSLIRGMGLGSATALNMIDMIGVGPFITMPLVVGAMGGPQALLGWVLGALFAMSDGLVWAELGAAMPGAGGSYRFLREIYGYDLILVRPDLHVVWRGNAAPEDAAEVAAIATGHALNR